MKKKGEQREGWSGVVDLGKNLDRREGSFLVFVKEGGEPG